MAKIPLKSNVFFEKYNIDLIYVIENYIYI